MTGSSGPHIELCADAKPDQLLLFQVVVLATAMCEPTACMLASGPQHDLCLTS